MRAAWLPCLLALLMAGCAPSLIRNPPPGSTPEESQRFEDYEAERLDMLHEKAGRAGGTFFNAEELPVYFESQDAFEAAEGFPQLYFDYGSAIESQSTCRQYGCYGGMLLGFIPLYYQGAEGILALTIPGGGILGGWAGHKYQESRVNAAGDKLKENVDLFDQVLRRKYKIPKDYPGGLDLR